MGRRVHLTNLQKPFWPQLDLSKGDLLRYYAAVAPVLLPHLVDRAMVMKRYPNGAAGEFFFMKRAPSPRPEWIEICAIEHASGNVIDFPIIRDLASLLWVVPIVRGPTQKEVWTLAKRFAREMATRYPKLITAEYRVAHRPRGRVLVDYNQNAWGRTLASVYSVRPTPRATASAPVTWEEIKQGIATEQFDLRNMPERVARLGDLWKPLLARRGRFRLEAPR